MAATRLYNQANAMWIFKMYFPIKLQGFSTRLYTAVVHRYYKNHEYRKKTYDNVQTSKLRAETDEQNKQTVI